jgi:hypothetical protein
LFPDGESAALLVQRLRENRWGGQIIGPHGSGKSTLLATLKPELETAGRQVLWITLHQGERRLPALDRRSLGPTTQLVIDGYEQLSWWSRWRVKWLCQRSGAGLLVTAHADVRLPAIYQTASSEQLVQAVAAQLLGDGQAIISSGEIAAAYEATDGNMRETLFRLYDIYQERGALRDCDLHS